MSEDWLKNIDDLELKIKDTKGELHKHLIRFKLPPDQEWKTDDQVQDFVNAVRLAQEVIKNEDKLTEEYEK